ncbi:MAG: cupin domain-containing protein [Verrucomicrobiales bacterium]|nr:cupin domain-containing protein [Verrucomicrobiales bacterium]
MTPGNLFESIPDTLNEELVEVLASGKGNFKIERIVSRGHQSPADFWYDEDSSEWVIVIKGAAQLVFEDSESPLDMKPGDWVEIPAHRRHRVAGTSPDEDTVWLAIHWK